MKNRETFRKCLLCNPLILFFPPHKKKINKSNSCLVFVWLLRRWENSYPSSRWKRITARISDAYMGLRSLFFLLFFRGEENERIPHKNCTVEERFLSCLYPDRFNTQKSIETSAQFLVSPSWYRLVSERRWWKSSLTVEPIGAGFRR